jgi:hypothetical protein
VVASTPNGIAKEQRQQDHGEMPAPDPRADPARVAVAEQQQGLEEHQAGGPDLEAPAKARQQQPAHHRLEREHQHRTEQCE